MTRIPMPAGLRLLGLPLFIALICCTHPLFAQDSATVHGIVTDPNGAVVPAASVTAQSMQTGAIRTTETNGSGLYSIPQLPPGEYQILVRKTGFQEISRSLNLTTSQDASIDFTFALAGTGQTVTVSAGAEQLDTAGSALSSVVQGRQVEQMPLNGRNVLNLVTLVPGVVPQGSSQGSPVGNQNGGSLSQPGGYGNYQIGGGFAGQSVIYIDGAPDNLLLQNNYVSLDPTQDAVQEFRVETNNINARFGGFNGGVINMTTRSGGNGFHGSAYEYLRNRVLNANNFFNNRNHIQRPTFTQNQYGTALGGPIIKNKTFFFFSWEDFALRQGNPLVLTVPTPLMRQGNFSEQPNALYDPCGGTVTTGGLGCPGYTGPRTPFVGNVIPYTRLDPTALVMLNYYPLPNLPGYVNNYAVNANTGGNSRQFNGRIDQTLTETQRLFGRVTHWHVTNPAEDPFRNGTGLPAQDNTSIQAVVGYTNALTPRTVLDLRVSWLDLHYYLVVNNNIDESQFGPAWAALSSQMQFHVLPDPSSITGGYTSGYVLGARNFQQHNFQDSTAFASLTHIIGRHSLELGGEFRTGKRFPALNVFNGSGLFSFSNGFTSRTLATQGTTGYGLASFLLGYAASGNIGLNQPVVHLLTAQGYYLADSYQATRKLNLNLGIRWDSPGAIREKHDLDTVLLPNQPDPLGTVTNPVTGQGQQLVGQLVLVNSPLYPSRYERKQDAGLFSPRFGFAYKLTDTAVLRGGFGISFARTIGTDVGPRQSPINAATTTMVNSLDGGVTPDATLSNPFPNTTLLRPAGRSQAALFTLQEGQPITGMVPKQPWSYTEQWNMSFQQALGAGAVMELAYAGANGLHLSRNGGYNLNQLPDQYDSLGPALTRQVPNPLFGLLPTSAGALAARTVPAGQFLRPYPQFQSVAAAQTFGGQSSYHALQASFQHRFGGGTLLAAYTWSKFIDNVDSLSSGFLDPVIGVSQDYTNLKADRSESAFSAPQRAVISYVENLPFGRGRRFYRSPGAVMDKLVSGWSWNGITTFQTGYPLPIVAQPTVLSSSFGAGTPRPNVVPGCTKRITGSAQSRLAHWFDTACFTQPSAYGFGNETRTDSTVRTAGIANWDTALMKTITLRESLNLQFTTEVFNLFNRVQFGIPNNVTGNGNFGVVSSQLNQPRLIQFSLRLGF